MQPGLSDLLVMGVQFLIPLLLWVLVRMLLVRTAHRLEPLLPEVLRAVVGGRLVPFLKRLILLLFFASLAVFAAYDVWVLSKGGSLTEAVMRWFSAVTPEWWIEQATILGKCLAVAVVAAIVLRPARTFLVWIEARSGEWLKRRKLLTSLDIPVRLAFEREEEPARLALTFQRTRTLLTWTVRLLVVTLWLDLVGAPASMGEIVGGLTRIYPFAGGIWAVRPVFSLGVEVLFGVLFGLIEPYGLTRYFEAVMNSALLVRRLLGTALSLAIVGLSLMQLERMQAVSGFLFKLMQVALTLLAARVLVELIEPLLREYFAELKHLSEAEKNRRRTLLPIFRGALQGITYLLMCLVILLQFGIDPLPIVAGAGVVGMALGLGARELISDIVAGFFMLIEDHFSVGDVISINNVEGQVQAIYFRNIWIRQSSGALHIINNGNIRQLANYSRSNVSAVITARVPYDIDIKVLDAVVLDLETWAHAQLPSVVGPVKLQGVKDFAKGELEIEVMAECLPGQHKRVMFPLRTQLHTLLRFHLSTKPVPKEAVTARVELLASGGGHSSADMVEAAQAADMSASRADTVAREGIWDWMKSFF